MTENELEQIVAAVLSALRTNGKTINQLTATTTLSDSDNLEVSGGRKISFAKLKEAVADAVSVTANEIKGYVVIESTSDLPEEPTTEQQQKAYLLGTVLYVYVGTGGDTLDGKYQSANMKGEDGNPGNDGVGFEDASTPTPVDGTAIIHLTNGDNIILNLNHVHPQYLKYELVQSLPASPDSGTLYLIAEE